MAEDIVNRKIAATSEGIQMDVQALENEARERRKNLPEALNRRCRALVLARTGCTMSLPRREPFASMKTTKLLRR